MFTDTDNIKITNRVKNKKIRSRTYFRLSLSILKRILTPKYTISTPLMIEKPVRSPIVPPIADNISTNLAALSLVILSKVVA